ncbi:MAG TPA: tyrosine-type recombinase/integrase [Pyrinomonadaceae bacterium]
MALYKRSNSKYWWTKFSFNGELLQRSTKCTNKADARIFESGLRTALALGTIGFEPKREAPVFEKAADDFLIWAKIEHALQPATYRRYYYSCRALKNYFGKVRMDRIETKNIEDFIVWRSSQVSRKTGVFITRETVNHELLTVKMIFNRLIEKKIVKENPARMVKRLSENERQFYVLSFEEEKRYLLACPQPLQDIAALMLETGMRCGEVYQLRRQDVYLKKGFLKVVKGKNKSSIRNVHLSEKAKRVLESRMKRFAGDHLFPQGDKDFSKPTESVDKQHLRTVENLKMKFRLYDCRHTFATRAVENAVDLLTLSQILGHASLRMVMRYSHPSENFKAEAIRKMEKAKLEDKAKAV